MLRALFEKTGNAVYISHLDLMRLFQRAFKRAGLHLTHTQGFNPRPSVSIALPLSLGVSSQCELLDFDLDGSVPSYDEIRELLNSALIDGVKVLSVYDNPVKIKHIALLDCRLQLEYDNGISEEGLSRIESLFRQEQLLVEKKSKNGVTEQDILPMIRKLHVERKNVNEAVIHARICCQNPALNPMQLTAAISKYLPELAPDFVTCHRVEIYDINETVFR